MQDITLLDANFDVYGDPIKVFESLVFDDAWEEHGTFSLILSPDEFVNVKNCKWLMIEGRLYKKQTALFDDKDLHVKVTGASPNALFDKIVISEPERLQGRLESCARYIVNKYAVTGSQRIAGLALGTDHGYARAMDATAERGQTLSSFLYEQLGQRGFSYQVEYDHDTGTLSFDVLRGLDRTQDQSVNIPVMLSTQDAIENASYKSSDIDYYNFAVVCDEDPDDPQTVEVDMSYGEPVAAFYVRGDRVERDPDATENLICIVGANGYVGTSVDGVAFTARSSDTTENLASVDYQNARFIAGGNNGAVTISTDAVTWAEVDTGSASSIDGVVYLDGLYIAFTAGGEIYYSYDADTWTLAYALLGGKATNAVWAGTRLVLYGIGSTSVKKAVSEDGTEWIGSNVAVSGSPTACAMQRTVYDAGKIVSAGYWYQSGTTTYKPLVIVSEDNGLTETVHIIESLSGHRFLDLAAGLGLLVAVGQTDLIAWSDDHGATWTECTPATAIDYTAIVFDGSTFYAYGNTTRKVATSTDGKNWTVQSITGVTQNTEAAAFCASSYLESLRQVGVTEILKRSVVETIDGDINADLAPVYKTDYNVGDVLDVDDPTRGITATKRVLKVEYVADKNNDMTITPKMGKDFLSLRQFIEKRR